MTKVTSSKKKSKPAQEGNVVRQEKPKKMGSEIDEIFAGKKRKRLEKEKQANTEKPAKLISANKKSHDGMKIRKSNKSNNFEGNLFNDDRTSRTRKKTAEGLTIYTEEELGIGKSDAGSTTLCPFDCDCCF